LNKNIVNKIKSKRYIKYNTKNLLEIMVKDPIASRIYKYISKIRYKNNKGEINVRTLAAIIPLKMEQRVEKIIKNGVKEYYLNRMKPVLTRILKAFDVLLELKYIVSFEEIYNKDEKTYYIAYVFNKERDGDCHMSEFIKKNEKNIVKENIDGVEEVIDLNADIDYQDNIEYLINKAKENPKITPKWNAWVDKKIKKILAEDGEEMLKRVYEETRNTIEEKALENIKKEVDNNNIDVILNVKNFSKTMYYKMIGTSIMKILKAEYSEVLENINKNDK